MLFYYSDYLPFFTIGIYFRSSASPCSGHRTPETPRTRAKNRRGPTPIQLILYELHHPAVGFSTYRPLGGMLGSDHSITPRFSATSLTSTGTLSHMSLTPARTSTPHSARINVQKRMQNLM